VNPRTIEGVGVLEEETDGVDEVADVSSMGIDTASVTVTVAAAAAAARITGGKNFNNKIIVMGQCLWFGEMLDEEGGCSERYISSRFHLARGKSLIDIRQTLFQPSAVFENPL
jgi:hypothetical protein